MAITLPYDFTSDTLTLARLQEVLDLLAASQSQVGAEDILPGAGIPQSKLGSITGTVQVEVPLTIQNVAAGWPASGVAYANVIGAVFLPLASDIWTVKGYRYTVYDSTVNATGSFRVHWGAVTTGNPPVWNQLVNVTPIVALSDLDSGATGYAHGSGTVNQALSSSGLASSPGCLAIVSQSAATNLLQTGVMQVVFTLERAVSL